MNTNHSIAVAQARLSTPIVLQLGKELPSDIQYMPPGKQTVAPSVDGEPMEMEITVTARYAEIFNRAAESMIAAAKAGQGDLPFGDFNHEDSAASVRPTKFWWGGEDPVTGGVRMDTPWTGTGAASLRNGEFVRWSPQWVFSRKTLEPLGLPCNVGGLVNRAAFKTIAPVVSAKGEESWTAGVDSQDPIADSQAGKAKGPDGQARKGDGTYHGPQAASSEALGATGDCASEGDHLEAAELHDKAAALHLAAGNKGKALLHKNLAGMHRGMAASMPAEQTETGELATAGAPNEKDNTSMTDKEMADLSAMVATASAKAVDSAMKPLSDKIVLLETQVNKNATDAALASAKAVLQPHIDRGAIAPQDTDTIKAMTDMVIANAAGAEKILGKLPGQKFQRLTTGTGTTGSDTGNLPQDGIMAAAKDLRKNNPDTFKSDADAVTAYLSSPAGKAAYEQYRDAVISGDPRLPVAQIRK